MAVVVNMNSLFTNDETRNTDSRRDAHAPHTHTHTGPQPRTLLTCVPFVFPRFVTLNVDPSAIFHPFPPPSYTARRSALSSTSPEILLRFRLGIFLDSPTSLKFTTCTTTRADPMLAVPPSATRMDGFEGPAPFPAFPAGFTSMCMDASIMSTKTSPMPMNTPRSFVLFASPPVEPRRYSHPSWGGKYSSCFVASIASSAFASSVFNFAYAFQLARCRPPLLPLLPATFSAPSSSLSLLRFSARSSSASSFPRIVRSTSRCAFSRCVIAGACAAFHSFPAATSRASTASWMAVMREYWSASAASMSSSAAPAGIIDGWCAAPDPVDDADPVLPEREDTLAASLPLRRRRRNIGVG